MFESDLREEQRNLQRLQSEVRQTVSRYESRLRDLKKQFDKANGSAEKQIQQLLAEFKSNIDSIIKDFERQIDKDLSMQRNSISEQESNAIRYLHEYKDKCERDYLLKAKSLVATKGEL
ncbi:MAG: hypothetical protein MR909_05765 [Clostridiales bacterium]|nr:hypothetical protein [Clostridiales bacterium]